MSSLIETFSISNSSVAEEIMSSVRETIQEYPFHVKDINKQVRIIDGTEEGTFSWISTNYLSGKFGVCMSLSVWLAFIVQMYCLFGKLSNFHSAGHRGKCVSKRIYVQCS